ncbi:MAG: outer membrane lipoprotein carrier protein LolA, partial [Flavobacteriaceae bacterium]|nr:outer membrane lipoprotein carrier protein LolA [Flavobacteriaceae bacterium]
MKTLNLFFVFTLFGCITVHAQSAEQAKKLLDAVYQKADSYQNMQIDFKYILENQAENIKQESNGKVIIEKDKYLLELLGAIQLFDGKKLYVVNEED